MQRNKFWGCRIRAWWGQWSALPNDLAFLLRAQNARPGREVQTERSGSRKFLRDKSKRLLEGNIPQRARPRGWIPGPSSNDEPTAATTAVSRFSPARALSRNTASMPVQCPPIKFSTFMAAIR